MTDEYKCNHCNQPFKDGECVAEVGKKGKDGLYHTIIRHLDREPIACLEGAVFSGQLDMAFAEYYIYYQSKLYDFSRVDRLPDSQKFEVNFNETNNGDRIIGDLSGLAKRGLLSRIFGCCSS